MMLALLLLPAAIMFIASFFLHPMARRLLPLSSFAILIPIVELFRLPKPYALWGHALIADDLNTYILLVSSIVGIGVTLALMTLDKHVDVTPQAIRSFYRFFALFWIGLTVSILANHMGIFWIGLEMATLSTVYMIKTSRQPAARKEAWNYMIVGAIAISLVLFGIILIYASAKPVLGEDAMYFDALRLHARAIPSPYLFEMGFAIATMGMFVKMGFFPMNLWLANIERAAFYPIAALFSGILESAVIAGFFRFSRIAEVIDRSHLLGYVFVYTLVTIFIVAFLIYRAKDFVRLFSLSGVEHMALIALFWVSGGTFAALLHFGAHAFLKPALFLSTGVLESRGRYHIAGALRGYRGVRGTLFYYLVTLFLLAIISLPPSPMFFSELYGFAAMIDMAEQSHHLLAMIAAILLLLTLLSVIFYRFVSLYQSMKYEGEVESKRVYASEVAALSLFALGLVALLLPASMTFLRSIG